MTHSSPSPMLGAPANGHLGGYEDSYIRQQYRDGLFERKTRSHKAKARRSLRRMEKQLLREEMMDGPS